MSEEVFGQGDSESDEQAEREAAKAQRRLLINSWNARDKLYKELFGAHSYVTPANYAAPKDDLSKPKKKSSKLVSTDTGDPGDPDAEEHHLAVLAYGPDPLRPYWTYVTAGLSTPWLQKEPDEVSAFGCELIIKTQIDAPWPAQILRSMAFYIFNHAGTISPGVRIGLNAPIAVNTESQLRNVCIWYADEAPDCWYQLPSGGFGLFCAIGITDDELKYAESIEEYGTWCIQEVLRQTGHGQISDPERKSVMERTNITAVLDNVKTFADKFRAGGF
ncbi:MAG: suppressor of fused domain protein [Candidatus Melainabacteria bacterium]|nr:suppressor of fused domain protein [Candidatus Melainabacteria bacterium]